jgi:predicted ester cyclase
MKSSIKILAVLLAALVIFSGCQQQQDHSKELKPILDRGVAVWNSGNIEEVDEIWAPSAIRSANQLPDVEGIDGIKAIDEEVYSENKAIIRWTFSGTNTGEGEMPPTGKQINIWGISILHFENGKLTREYVSFDNQPLLEQLGFTLTPSSSDEES